MYDYITLDNAAGSAVVLHSGNGRAVSLAEGLIGVSGVREVAREAPQQHGSIIDTRFAADRVISIEGECWGASAAAARDVFGEIAAAAWDTLSAPRLLRWQYGGGGRELQTLVKLSGSLTPPAKGRGNWLQYKLALRAEDPRAYAQDPFLASGGTLSAVGGGRTYPLTYPYVYLPVGGGEAVMNVDTEVPTPPRLVIYGRCLNPVVRLESTGEEIAINGEIGAGDFLELRLDGRRRVALLNGSTNRLRLVDFKRTTWWELPPGPQTVSLHAASFDTNARVDVEYRPAYL